MQRAQNACSIFFHDEISHALAAQNDVGVTHLALCYFARGHRWFGCVDRGKRHGISPADSDSGRDRGDPRLFARSACHILEPPRLWPDESSGFSVCDRLSRDRGIDRMDCSDDFRAKRQPRQGAARLYRESARSCGRCHLSLRTNVRRRRRFAREILAHSRICELAFRRSITFPASDGDA